MRPDLLAFTVASLPGRGRANPYVDLLYSALEPYGVSLDGEPKIDDAWASAHFGEIDAIHFHWPEYIWQHAEAAPSSAAVFRLACGRVPGLWRTEPLLQRAAASKLGRRLRKARVKWQAVRRFKGFLKSAKSADVKIIWTLHNLVSHENWTAIDRVGFRTLGKYADLVICHSEDARSQCIVRYRPRCPVVVMPHGNYDGVYPQPRSRTAVLAELGLDPAVPLVGCIGAMREYKGLDIAVEAKALLGDRVQLLCAGAPHRLFPLSDLEQLAAGHAGIKLLPRSLSDQEFADFSNACDVLLFPYRWITGSGALLAGLTLGRGVVASDLPYFREVLAGSADAGLLVPAGNPDALAVGIERCLGIPPARREAAARALADRYAWATVVLPVVEALRGMPRKREATDSVRVPLDGGATGAP